MIPRPFIDLGRESPMSYLHGPIVSVTLIPPTADPNEPVDYKLPFPEFIERYVGFDWLMPVEEARMYDPTV